MIIVFEVLYELVPTVLSSFVARDTESHISFHSRTKDVAFGDIEFCDITLFLGGTFMYPCG